MRQPVHASQQLKYSSVLAVIALLLAMFAGACTACAEDSLPDAPQPQARAAAQLGPCQVRNAGATLAAAGASRMLAVVTGQAEAPAPGPVAALCPVFVPIIDWYARFLDGPRVKALSPKQKAWLAIRNVGDPFNAVTILATSGISIGADSHSVYGPGMSGFGRLVGVSYAEDMTGEFIGTFLIPSIAHQDPHYHRAPQLSISRRVLHTATAVVWGQGDDGHGMLNYANLIGFGADIAIANLYVPGRSTNVPASFARYGIGLALAPTDNMITEFLPDLARHIHFRVVAIQRIIDRVGLPEATTP